ncbi:MAG: UDP-glucose 4-epimerase GalE [Deltaproteobacteria bacterium]|nr:MAG: UDP-glucose 4-epimerase GalE [Deltaproteobacteria bacterium]
MPPRILIVGGAGYIGSCCAALLQEAGWRTECFDDLSTGHRQAVRGPLHVGDIRDRAALSRVLAAGRFDGVMHFAARSLVGESTRHPLRYFDNNVAGTISLLQVMADHGVNRLVFSSTCAIYGTPERLPIDESHPRAPVSPYGESKELVERVLAQVREREGLQVTTLRYFNAAGALPEQGLGESHHPETHLIPLAIQAALGQRPPLAVFGDDYPTRDGTCVRDYIHVADLAEAHRLAMQRLLDGDAGDAYNVGTGIGTTVREVLDSVGRVLGTPVPHHPAPRREGDPPELYAQADRIRRELGWQPRQPEIDDIVRTAAAWAASPRF